ncbi:uncharacterized protein PolZ1 [Anabrus simplex]|uniref:uncharacterized protein PolZ1 n=1 Tax=Anabrus simplex TaxID=316456 RepID=UPI0035A2EE01
MFSVRLVTVDYYTTPPISGLDSGYSEFRGAQVKQVPVVRVFGASSTGQKTCLHIHGVFPYIYVPFDGSVDHNRFMYQLASSIDKAINISLGQASATAQHVYKICLVSGMPFYGFHTKKHQFFKIYFYNPLMVKKAAELLQNGAILNQVFQPHEAHVPFILQFMIDFNLYGMNLVTLRHVKFRRGTESSEVLENIPEELLLPERVSRLSTCELELDALAADIVNKNEITGQLSVNPGLKAIWEEEMERRRGELRSSLPTPLSSQPRLNVQPTDSELFYKDQLQKKLAALTQIESTQSTPSEELSDGGKLIPYPAETPEGVSLLDASFLQLHVPSVAESKMRANHLSPCSDDSVVNEEIVLSLISSSQQASQKSEDTLILSSEDLKLAEVLQELIDDDSILGSQKPTTEQGEDSEDEEQNEGLHDLTQTMEELEKHSPGRPPAGIVSNEAIGDGDGIWEDSFWSDISDNIPQLDGANDLLEPTSPRKSKKRNNATKSLVRRVLEKTTATKSKMDMKDEEGFPIIDGLMPSDIESVCTVGRESPTPSEISSDGSVEFLCEVENSVNDTRSVCESEMSDVVGDAVSLQTELFTDNFSSFPLTDASDPAFTSVPTMTVEYEPLCISNSETDDSLECGSEVEFNIDTNNHDRFFKGVLIGDPSFTAQLNLSEKDELLENQTCGVPESWANDGLTTSTWLSKERNLVDTNELDADCDLLRPYEDEVLEGIVIEKNTCGELLQKHNTESSLNCSSKKRGHRKLSKCHRSEQLPSENSENVSLDSSVKAKLRSWRTKVEASDLRSLSLPQDPGLDKSSGILVNKKQLCEVKSVGKIVSELSEESSFDKSGDLLKNSIDLNDNLMESSIVPRRISGIVNRMQELFKNNCKLDVDKQLPVSKESSNTGRKQPSIPSDSTVVTDEIRRIAHPCLDDLRCDAPCSSKEDRSALRRRCQQKVKVSEVVSEPSLLNLNSIDITEKHCMNSSDSKSEQHGSSAPHCIDHVPGGKYMRTPRRYSRRTLQKKKNTSLNDATSPVSPNNSSVILPIKPHFGACSVSDVPAETTTDTVIPKSEQTKPELESKNYHCISVSNSGVMNKNVKELLKQKINSKKDKPSSSENVQRNKKETSDIERRSSERLVKSVTSETNIRVDLLTSSENEKDFTVMDEKEVVESRKAQTDSTTTSLENLCNSEHESNSRKEVKTGKRKSKQNSKKTKEPLKNCNDLQETSHPAEILSRKTLGKSEAVEDMHNSLTRICSSREELSIIEEENNFNLKLNSHQSSPDNVQETKSVHCKNISKTVKAVADETSSINSVLPYYPCDSSPSSFHFSAEVLKSFHVKPCYVKLSRVNVNSQTKVKEGDKCQEYQKMTSVVSQCTSLKNVSSTNLSAQTTLSTVEKSTDDSYLNKRTGEPDQSPVHLTDKIPQFHIQNVLQPPNAESAESLKNNFKLQNMNTLKFNRKPQKYGVSDVDVKSPKIPVGSPRKTRSLSGLKSVLQAESPRVADTIDTLPENARTIRKYASACIPSHHDDGIVFKQEETRHLDKELLLSSGNCNESKQELNCPSNPHETLQALSESNINKTVTSEHETKTLQRVNQDNWSLDKADLSLSESKTKVGETSSRSPEVKVVRSGEDKMFFSGDLNGSKSCSCTCVSDRELDLSNVNCVQSKIRSNVPSVIIRTRSSRSLLHSDARDNFAGIAASSLCANNLQLNSHVSDKAVVFSRRASFPISETSPGKRKFKAKQKYSAAKYKQDKNKLVCKETEDSDDNVPLVEIKHALVNVRENQKNMDLYSRNLSQVLPQYLNETSSDVTGNRRIIQCMDVSAVPKQADLEMCAHSNLQDDVLHLKLEVQACEQSKNVPVNLYKQSSKHSSQNVMCIAEVEQGVPSLSEFKKTRKKKPRVQIKVESEKSSAVSPPEKRIKISTKENINKKRIEVCKENDNEKLKVVQKRKCALSLKPAKVVLLRLGDIALETFCSGSSPEPKRHQIKSRQSLNKFKKVISLDGTVDSSASEDSEDFMHVSQKQSERPPSSSSGEMLVLPSQTLSPSPKKYKKTDQSPIRTPVKASYKPLEVKITKSPKQRKAVQSNVKKLNVRSKLTKKRTVVILNQQKLTAEDLKAFQPYVLIERLDLQQHKLKVFPVSEGSVVKPQQNSALCVSSITAVEKCHLKKSSRSVIHSGPTGVSIAGSSRVCNRDDPTSLNVGLSSNKTMTPDTCSLLHELSAKQTKQWGIVFNGMAPQSQDLNPIELLWEELDRSSVVIKISSQSRELGGGGGDGGDDDDDDDDDCRVAGWLGTGMLVPFGTGLIVDFRQRSLISRRKPVLKLQKIAQNKRQHDNSVVMSSLPSDMTCSESDVSDDQSDSLSSTYEEGDSFVPSSQDTKVNETAWDLGIFNSRKDKSVRKRLYFSQKTEIRAIRNKKLKEPQNTGTVCSEHTEEKNTDSGVINFSNQKTRLKCCESSCKVMEPSCHSQSLEGKTTGNLSGVIDQSVTASCSPSVLYYTPDESRKSDHRFSGAGTILNVSASLTLQKASNTNLKEENASVNKKICSDQKAAFDSLSLPINTQTEIIEHKELGDCREEVEGCSSSSLQNSHIVPGEAIMDIMKEPIDDQKVSIEMFRESASSQSELSEYKGSQEMSKHIDKNLSVRICTNTSSGQNNFVVLASPLQGEGSIPLSQNSKCEFNEDSAVICKTKLNSCKSDRVCKKLSYLRESRENKTLEVIDCSNSERNADKVDKVKNELEVNSTPLEQRSNRKESTDMFVSLSHSELLTDKVNQNNLEENLKDFEPLGLENFENDAEDDNSDNASEGITSFYGTTFNLTQMNLSWDSNISDSYQASQQQKQGERISASQSTVNCDGTVANSIDLNDKQNEFGVVYIPKWKPPTREEIQNSLSQFGIPEHRYQEPFVSNISDVMRKELSERTLKLGSRSVNELVPFECTVADVNGVALWRKTRVQELWEETQAGTFEESNITQLGDLKSALATENETVITPCRAPPTTAEVRLWLHAKQALKSASCDGEAELNAKPELLQIMIPQSPGMMGENNECITLTPTSPALEHDMETSIEKNTPSTPGVEGNPVHSTPDQGHHPQKLPHTPCTFMNNDHISLASSNSVTKSPAATTIKWNKSTTSDEEDNLVHSTPHQYLLSRKQPSPPCTPIQILPHRSRSPRRGLWKTMKAAISEIEDLPTLPVICEEEPGPSHVDTGPGVNEVSSSQSSPAKSEESVKESSLHRLLLQSQFRRQLVSPHQKHSSCQIEGTTPDNTFGFKMSYENLQDVRALTEYQFLTLLVMELHVQTRGDLRPDPAFDPIQVLFYVVVNDVPDGYLPKEQLGMIVVKDAVDPHKNPLKGTGIVCDITTFVDTEKDLMNEVVSLIRKWDPDILAGYEVEMLSWGYLFQRAFNLEINLCPLVSRVPTAKNDSYVKEDDKKDAAPAFSLEIALTGRIVLNVWRLMRHEVALMSYTFENVMYHVLHQRVPLHSFRLLTQWWAHRTRLYRWRTAEHYLLRVRGIVKILDQLDLVARTSELARLFGIQFYEVLSRGSQFRVESMMLRLAKPLNYVPVSPSIRQRAQMRAPESLPLIMEPESRFYVDPVIVLDFQSLYPSMIIAYNYCFSTCLGRVEHLGQSAPFEFGCTRLRVPPSKLKNLLEKINISPCGVAFVQKSVRQGVLPRMLEEILDTRLMVKKSMKEHKDNKTLQRVLHSRQLGLKLIANVTYGYTAANFSGRMPCIEVGDSVVSKGRETLERAIHMVEKTERWGARVIYGDTDSLFLLVPGRSRAQAFEIGAEIAEAVTQDNPKPVKLKLEKVYQPCLLQTKKRYVGYMYESPDQEKPVYDAKGIETVRRDGCPAVAKILEKSLRLLFENRDVSLVKNYVQRQFSKLLQGRTNLQDLIFAREYRGMAGYRPGACVPALELARQWLQTDKRAEPRVGERVPYVVVNGPPNLPLIRLVRSPHDLLTDYSLRVNAQYYITRVIIPPLDRCFSLIGADVESWYTDLPRKFTHYLPTSVTDGQKKSTISQYFATTNCAACGQQTHSGLCAECQNHPQSTAIILADKLRQWERTYSNIVKVCQSCCGHTDSIECTSLDCPVLFRRHQAARDLQQADFVRSLQEQYLAF